MSFISKYLWKSSNKPATTSTTSELRKLASKDSPAGLKTLTGRFGVGFVDVEWEDTENLLSTADETKLLGHELPFVLARIYYPTKFDDQIDEKMNGTWLPSSQYFPGYGYFIRLPALVSSGIGRFLASNVRIRAKEAAPLISILDAGGKEHLPVVIFSHGLAGIRTTYSTICCEMASRGMVVLALEHRDGSASMTIDQKGKVYPYQFGPSGLSLPMVDYDFRSAQLQHRIKELQSTTQFIESLHEAGDFASIILSSAKLPETLKQFKGRLLTERLILMGHSFGGATCMASAQQLRNVHCCMAWDPWMFPMPQPNLPVTRTNLDTLLIINEKFVFSENDVAIQKFIDDFRFTDKCFGKARMLGCGHMDQSDLASIIPSRIIRLLRPNSSIPVDHHRILQANVDLVAAQLAYSFPMYEFDGKWSMFDLQQSPLLPEDYDTGSALNELIDPLIKLESFINYK